MLLVGVSEKAVLNMGHHRAYTHFPGKVYAQVIAFCVVKPYPFYHVYEQEIRAIIQVIKEPIGL